MILRLGTINKNIFSIMIGGVFAFSARLLLAFELMIFQHPILINIFISAGKIFALIPFVILKIRVKKNKISNENNGSINIKKFIHKTQMKELIKGKWIYILLSSLTSFIQSILLLYTLEIKTNFWIVEIVFTSLFYYLILKVKLYKHHYLSIIIIVSTGIILDLVFKNLQNDLINSWLLFLLRLFREIVFSLREVIEKYAMEKKFCSVYEIFFYSGLINLILFGIFGILNYYYFSLDNFEEYFNKFNNREILISLGVTITQFGLYLCILFTNNNYTPCHVFIIYIFGQLAYYTDFSTNSIIFIICLIFILFISLIFNEIIELNCFGLEKNTRQNIARRADMLEFSDRDSRVILDNYEIEFISQKEENNESQLIELKSKKENS